MLQKPLEEGDAVRFSGLGLTVCLTLFAVAQQCVKQFSHPPLPLPKPLDHCWELLELSVRTQLDLRDVGHGGRNPLQHAPELRVEDHVLRATTELPDIRVHYDQCSPGRLHLRPVHTECPCSTDKRGFYRQLH